MPRAPSENSVAYEVVCECGQTLRGSRQGTHQIICCTTCGRKRFILPSSPWLKPRIERVPTRLNLRRFFLVIVVGGVVAMGLCLLLIRPYLRRTGASTATLTGDIHFQLQAGKQQLREGNVFLALSELNAAFAHYSRYPNSLSSEQGEDLQQLLRQTDLLSRLLDLPLEEILVQAMQHRSAEEWTEKFTQYQGRTVIFDDVLRRDGQGRLVLGFYTVRAAGVEAKVALEDLTLLRRLPLDTAMRCLFGARLENCRREEGGIWVFRFDPNSAVLLTEEDAAAVFCPLPLNEELRGVLKRQKEWLRH